MNLAKACTVKDYINASTENTEYLSSCFQEAVDYIKGYNWLSGIKEAYVGMYFDGILSVFLLDLELNNEKQFEDDNYVWVIVGDLPPAYITSEDAPNPACALDGYVGAMYEWVNAVSKGESVEKLIPVNVMPTVEYAQMLKQRLEFIDQRILSSPECKTDLKK